MVRTIIYTLLISLIGVDTLNARPANTNTDFALMKENCNFRSIQNDCLRLGFYYIESRLESDTGIAYLKKSCLLGSGVGCMSLGEIYKNGSFKKEVNYKKAKYFYSQSCMSGEKLGCDAYNSLYIKKDK